MRELQKILDNDIWQCAQHLLPHYSFGDIHKEMLESWANPRRGETMRPNILTLVPREHLKSVCAVLYAVWRIARNPMYTILYRVADEDLGKIQINMIKTIFQSDEFMKVWPDHFFPEEGRRSKWSALAVSTDHPDRQKYNIRDESFVIKTNKSGKTGRHPDEIIFDDVVVVENAYTVSGRKEVSTTCSADVSLVTGKGLMTAVGTRYFPTDQYHVWEEELVDVYNDERELTGQKKTWTVMERVVEDKGDGSGSFLWEKVWNPTMKQFYGWDPNKLASKRASYRNEGNLAHYYAQYYMNPNDPDSNELTPDKFVYLNPKLLVDTGNGWKYNSKKLNIIATMDTAQTDRSAAKSSSADFTAVGVIGMDADRFIYCLALDQFKTDKKEKYYQAVKDLYSYWGFTKIYVETNAAGKFIAGGLKDSIRGDGLPIRVEGVIAPNDRTKAERTEAILLPRYTNGDVLHTKGGFTPELEEQVMKARPAHDDLRDVMVIGAEKLTPPARSTNVYNITNTKAANSRFGGRARRRR